MLSKVECIRTRSPITALDIVSRDSFVFSTLYNGAKIVSFKDCTTQENITIKQLNYQTTAIDFSMSLNIMAFANSNVIYIYDIKNKHIMQTIRTNEGKITLLKFMPSSPYIIAGTSHGRVMQYRFDGRSQLSRLCSFGHQLTKKSIIKNNYVSAIAFYEDYLACSGYGGMITVIKLNSRALKINIQNSKVRINSLVFLDKHTLVSGNSDGIVQIQQINKYKNAKNILTPFTTIKEIVKLPDTNYILVSGDSQDIIVIDTSIAKIISTRYLSFNDDIEKMKLTLDNDLLVFLKHKHLVLAEMPKPQHLKSYIFQNKLDKALNLIERYPTLKGTREHKRVEVLYEKQYAEAVNALIKSNKKEALRIVEVFKNVDSKSDEISKIFHDFDHYHRFRTLYLEKKHSLAYPISERYPSLKRTLEYKKMEEKFKENFNFAQKQVLIGREDIAKEILSPYINVHSKRDMLNLILKHNEEFIIFLKAIEKKNYDLVEKLAKKHPTFKTIPSYISLQNDMNEEIDKIKDLLRVGDLEEAKTHILNLEKIGNIESELKYLKDIAKEIVRLNLLYKNDKFVQCYEFIDKHPHLDDLELTALLEKHWGKLILECEELALKGDLKSIKSTLGELIKIDTRIEKIGDLIRVSFHTKIKALIANRSLKNAENIIYSYSDIFGIDSEILYIMKIYEKVASKKLAITVNKDSNIPRDNWRKSKLIMG